MSLGSPKLARREQAIEAARRRIRKLEIETHRVKAALARLEADYEDDVADFLSRKLRRRSHPGTRDRVDAAPASEPVGRSPAFGGWRGKRGRRRRPVGGAAADALPRSDLPQLAGGGENGAASWRVPVRRSPARSRKQAAPLALSLALHLMVLFLGLSFSFATLVQTEAPLLASPTDFNEAVAEEFSEIEIEPTRFEDPELQNVVHEDLDFNLSDNSLEMEAAEIGAGTQPLGDLGQLDSLPSDLGTLMAGAGSPGSGAAGGPAGAAVFFGARSQGDRFVFVVDNSSSMKGGRFEMATAELLRTIGELSPKQSFYVIFVSDKTYPMFYPSPAADMVPATPENKERLAKWVPNAILASGNNRELIKAMDLAATLRPNAVFLLWDGDLKYSDKVRMEVMTHLTRPNQWSFTIHTLGMGVTSLDAEQNLAAIAQTHGGMYLRVNVPAARTR